MIEFLDIPGKRISSSELSIKKAHNLALAIQSEDNPNVSLLECKCLFNEEEVVIFEIEIELGQKRVYEILNTERIGICFDPIDKKEPDVLALRKDFPLTPHQYLKEEEFPRNLCLFDEDYEEIKLFWNPIFFLNQLRTWLVKTAQEKLHYEDQLLEPILLGSPINIVVPDEVLSESSNKTLMIYKIDGCNNRVTLVVEDIKKDEGSKVAPTYLATTVYTPPLQHGIIRSIPRTIGKLHELLHSLSGTDLVKELRKQLLYWLNNKPLENFTQLRLIIFLLVPKKRYADSNFEAVEKRAFLAGNTIAEIGDEIGIWGFEKGKCGGKVGQLIRVDETKYGANIKITSLNIMPAFTRKLASDISGEKERTNKRITAIGVGALGSQVFLNLAKSGFGEWILIDHDFLLPHNLARHALSNFVGHPKANTLAIITNEMIYGNPIAQPIVSNVLNAEGEEKKAIDKAFKDSDIILDMSTSIAVERHIARDIDSDARRIAFFLNPNGTDSVILAEDQERRNTLDILEMQYYRHLIIKPELENHLKNESFYRYSNSCRSLTNLISQDLVALHAANGCRRLRRIINEEKDSIITIFRTHKNGFEVECKQFKPEKIIKYLVGEWRLYTDQWFVNKVTKSRTEKLPNETGGVLVGSFDNERRIIYVVDSILSPEDSEEWPQAYIRGKEKLLGKLKEIEDKTYRKLRYIGEWHSHPDGCTPEPSDDDSIFFEWLKIHMKLEGLPPVMLIMGTDNEYRFFVDQLCRSK
jgi:proteasome lid subunit RPN8/RPN11